MALAAFERARDLTRRLLTFAKHRGAERRPVDLCQLLDECISLSLSGSGVRCEKAYSTGPVIANVDPGQIAQVFSNLLVNARQAMNDRGTITARVERGAGAEAEAVVISIGDDGPGIPEDTLPYIFDPYFTTKKDGSGLGLATCQSIVHDHGGRISVASQAKRGTTFRIHMPGLPSETPLPQAARPAQVGKAQGRILILDDEPAIQSLLKKAMAHVGYEVVAVGRGEDAVVAFQRAQASGRAFDLFLSDLTVPGGMGGMETLAELRRLDAQILAVAMTGYDEDSVTAELKQQGFARLLPKPFLLHELFATIQAVLPRP
jgi:CheY-like chemotaxis protein